MKKQNKKFHIDKRLCNKILDGSDFVQKEINEHTTQCLENMYGTLAAKETMADIDFIVLKMISSEIELRKRFPEREPKNCYQK